MKQRHRIAIYSNPLFMQYWRRFKTAEPCSVRHGYGDKMTAETDVTLKADATTAVDATPAQSSPGATSQGTVSWAKISIYSLPTVPLGFMFLFVGLYLMKFSTDVLYIAPAAMGTIFGLSRIWDAVSDPLVGYFSDRTKTRWGRRRPWMFVAAIPIGGMFLFMFMQPDSIVSSSGPPGGWNFTNNFPLVAWMAVAVIGFYSVMTVFLVPHMSLGAEMTTDYHERNKIFGFRHAGWTLGSMLALIGMSALIFYEQSGDGPAAAQEAARGLAWKIALFVGVLACPLVFLTGAKLRERADFVGRGAHNPFKAFADLLRNRHARLLLIVTTIESLGGATIGILTLYVAQYVVGTPLLAPVYILAYMIPSFIFVPIWIPLARRFGKKNLWTFSMVLTGLSFGGMFFLQEGSIALIIVLAAFAGFAAGCGGTIAPSVQSDVIDYDEYLTGERKEGTYFAAWSFANKLTVGLTAMLTGYVLQISGFVPNVEQTDTVKLALRSLYSLYPLACYLIGALIFTKFSLDEEEHRRIRAELDRRAAEAGKKN